VSSHGTAANTIGSTGTAAVRGDIGRSRPERFLVAGSGATLEDLGDGTRAALGGTCRHTCDWEERDDTFTRRAVTSPRSSRATTTDSKALTPLEAALALARSPEDLRLVAQPLVDTASGEIAGFELLARFPRAWGVLPQDVFEAAEAHGLSPALTCHVLEQATRLRDQLPARTFLTVNCSPSDLVDPAVRLLVQRLDLSRMFVELTESAWPTDEQTVLEAADEVRARGGRIAADDVGAGYSGLLQLIRLRPDMVKIDRDIVRRIDVDSAAAALVAMLGELAGRLDAWIVVEGVETEAQLAAAVRLGVPLVQGYYFSLPEEPWTGISGVATVRRLSGEYGDGDGEQVATLQRPARLDELVLDDTGHPVGIRVEGLGVVRPLTMSLATPVVDAARRVMLRTRPAERIAPVVVTDEGGAPVGVVPVELLVERLLAAQLQLPA
jgi:EAL domain-containing protein (putative c-di-GMP-specific phosphodiesterase class I)